MQLLLKTAKEKINSSGYSTFLDTQSKSLIKVSNISVLEPQLFSSLENVHM